MAEREEVQLLHSLQESMQNPWGFLDNSDLGGASQKLKKHARQVELLGY